MRRDIAIEQISDVLAVDDGSFVWVGLYEPDARLLDKLQEEFGLHRPRGRGCAATRTSAPRSRPTATRCSSRCTPRRCVDGHDPLRRDPRLRRPALHGDRAPRRVARSYARRARAGARAGAAGATARRRRCTRCSTSIVDNYHADRRGIPGGARRRWNRTSSPTTSAARRSQAVRTQARTDADAAWRWRRCRTSSPADRAMHGGLIAEEVPPVLPRRAGPRRAHQRCAPTPCARC